MCLTKLISSFQPFLCIFHYRNNLLLVRFEIDHKTLLSHAECLEKNGAVELHIILRLLDVLVHEDFQVLEETFFLLVG